MVSTKRTRSQRTLDSQTFISFLCWVRVLCSGCFGTVPFKRPRCAPVEGRKRAATTAMAGILARRQDMKLLLPRDRGGDVHEEDEEHCPALEAFAWEEKGEDEEDRHMFEGRFFVGTRILNEVEMRSPVEEKKGVATIVKSSASRLHTPISPSSCQRSDLASGRLRRMSATQGAGSQKDAAHSWDQGKLSLAPAIQGKSCQIAAARDTTGASSYGETGCTNFDSSPVRETACAEVDRCSAEDAKSGRPNATVDQNSSHSALAVVSRPSFEHAQSDAICIKGDYLSATTFKLEASSIKAPRKPDVSVPFEISKIKSGNSILSLEGKTELSVGSLPDSKNLAKNESGNKAKCRIIRSLTDHDFAELRGCIDLGFVFTEEDVLDLRDTLPALEACYAIAQGTNVPACNCEDSGCMSPRSPPISPWRIASPGDKPQQVKTRLRHWAQAVACTLRQPC